MTLATRSRSRLSALTAACLLTLAMPASPVFAKTKEKPAAETTAPSPFDYKFEIPTIDLVGANMDEATLRDILGGNIVPHAAELAALDAASITIPQINFTYATVGDKGAPATGTVKYTDIVLSDVVDGVVGSVAVGATTVEARDVSSTFGTMSAKQLNIAAMLGAFGLVPEPTDTSFQTIYADFTAEGGTISGPDADCEIGKVTLDEFQARPLKTNFLEIIALASEMEANDGNPPPETVGKLLRIYADLFTAFKSTPAHFSGLDCSGDADGEQFAMKARPDHHGRL
ncbi:hypothetical protein PSQ19_06300 [Devosia algicola]|uniref:Uncharacterized protein n=1 Tax=Devosia algicola TaxID=3026418 RepID=A0ABY7YQR4_9HYPH|nr:hypothetical protein [Devosia algicola]WDR03674.1 hypothetical protein PSQ19_06300 [Devosia algicola]